MFQTNVKVKCSHYRPGCGPEGGTRRGWVVCSTPRPYFTPGKDPVPIVQEAGWAPGLVWTGGKSRPTGIRSPDCPAHSQSLYQLSYPFQTNVVSPYAQSSSQRRVSDPEDGDTTPFQTLGNYDQSTQCHIYDDLNRHQQSHDNLAPSM
jgi:hypothetical protein